MHMARRPRLQFSGAVYHLMARGNRKSTIFEDDVDRRRFIATLAEAVRRYKVLVYSLCLMGNHYHIVCETPYGNLSDFVQYVNGVYAQASNRRHERTGHLFQARFRSLVIQRERYLRRVVRYLDRNPVRAGLTPDAESWPWSTHRGVAGLRPAPDWLCLDWLEWAFDATSRREAQTRYRLYVNHRSGVKAHIDTTAIAIGSQRFKDTLAFDGPGINRHLPLVLRPVVRPSLVEVFAPAVDVSTELGSAIRSAHEVHRYTVTEIARHLGLDRSTVGKTMKKLARPARLESID